jgi:hypothetical protein
MRLAQSPRELSSSVSRIRCAELARLWLNPIMSIEHAIGGMKRYNILVHVFRNHKADFEDDAVGICAGLWNFVLSY